MTSFLIGFVKSALANGYSIKEAFSLFGNRKKPVKKIRANSDELYQDNVPGRYFVDHQCIDCDLCRELAPTCFKRNDQEGHCYVSRQPVSPAEEKECRKALQCCPVNAIGTK